MAVTYSMYRVAAEMLSTVDSYIIIASGIVSTQTSGYSTNSTKHIYPLADWSRSVEKPKKSAESSVRVQEKRNILHHASTNRI